MDDVRVYSRALSADENMAVVYPQLPPPELGQFLLPYEERRLEKLIVVRAEGKFKIDGSLDDWDLSERFTARTADPYGSRFYFQGARMDDEEFCYVGAHVGDPAPMRTMIDPLVEPSVAWKGGGLQLRLSTDSSQPWPLHAEGSGLPGRPPAVGKRPEDLSDQLVHLILWYFRSRREASLHVARGMDFHEDAAPPRGWQGAYRKDPDGSGEHAGIRHPMGGSGSDPGRLIPAVFRRAAGSATGVTHKAASGKGNSRN